MAVAEKLQWVREECLELLFPQRCCFCRRLTGKGELVCKLCRKKYPDLPSNAQLRELQRDLKCYSPLRYGGAVRDALLRYKFWNTPAYAPAFGDFMVRCLDENAVTCDVVTWVPLSRKRLRTRGYDQARLLAEEVAAREGWPIKALLIKPRNTKAQSGLKSREQRQANAAGAYRVIEEQEIAGKHILLVDDIVTSGATLRECARMLRQAGARSVTAVTAAARTD